MFQRGNERPQTLADAPAQLCKQGVTGSDPGTLHFLSSYPAAHYEWRGVSLWEKESAIVTEILTDQGLFWLP